MRLGVFEPETVIGISALAGGADIYAEGDVVHIGALALLNVVAGHELVATRFPVLWQAIHKAVSPQVRNLATIGGNPLQRMPRSSPSTGLAGGGSRSASCTCYRASTLPHIWFAAWGDHRFVRAQWLCAEFGIRQGARARATSTRWSPRPSCSTLTAM
jgi:CO/xanthine dehydrogenase FAD-binding subunit